MNVEKTRKVSKAVEANIDFTYGGIRPKANPYPPPSPTSPYKPTPREPAKVIELKPDDIIHPVTDDMIISDEEDVSGMIMDTIDSLIDKTVDKIFHDAPQTRTGVKAAIKTPAQFVRSSWEKSTTPYESSYSWSSSKFKDGYMQPSGMTKEERYPKIYDSAAKLKPKAKRVLSFGCSTGEEAFALAKRFPNATQVVGADIDYSRICTARKNNKNTNVYFYDTAAGLGQFDVVTALNVFFCLDKPIPKENWIKTLEEVAGYVAPGGVLMIFKSDYDPMDVLAKLNFKAENVWNHTHNRNNKDYFCGYYRKTKHWWQ